MDQALKLIRKFKAEALGFGTGYGIVGALAAIGETLEGDHTYEVIAYRTPENRGTPRQLDSKSVRKMNQKTTPQTFNNIDLETQRILITPRGPDPILYAIRGETSEAVVQAHNTVQALEPIERWVVFRTNHGTDAHLRRIKTISEIRPFQPVIATGTVASKPRLVPRRHRIFTVEDKTGKVDCAAYEPTGRLRKIARQLIPGDFVEVFGGVKPSTSEHPLTVNLEKMRILKLAPKLTAYNPKCSKCKKRMSSMGVGQGFRCPKCGFRSSNKQKILVEEKRDISEGLFITSPRSQRHLTKPFSRYGREKNGKPKEMLSQWHNP
jgi:tRNA(Ile2)-agmatinylcytidine synthase